MMAFQTKPIHCKRDHRRSVVIGDDYTIALPETDQTGCYDKDQLFRYVNLCRKYGRRDFLMSQDLNVPVHRIVYMLGGGFEIIFKDQIRDQAA